MRQSVKCKSKASKRKKGGARTQQDFQRRYHDLPDDLQRMIGNQVLGHHASRIQRNFRNFSRNERRNLMIANILETARMPFDYNDLRLLNDKQLENLERYVDAAFVAGMRPWSDGTLEEMLHDAELYRADPISLQSGGRKKKRKTRKKRLTKKRKH